MSEKENLVSNKTHAEELMFLFEVLHITDLLLPR